MEWLKIPKPTQLLQRNSRCYFKFLLSDHKSDTPIQPLQQRFELLNLSALFCDNVDRALHNEDTAINASKE